MQTFKPPLQSRGATLFISLIVLLLLTLIGVTAITTSVFEEKMSSNLQDTTRSFQAAESSLREGEAWVLLLSAEPTPGASCSPQPCVLTQNPSRQPGLQNLSWWLTNGAPFTSGALSEINTPPRYIVEYERFVPDSLTLGQGVPTGNHYYRVTSQGTGSSDDAVTILQTTLPRRF